MTEAGAAGREAGWWGAADDGRRDAGPTVTPSRARRGLGAAAFARARRADARGAHRGRVEAEKRRRVRAAAAGAAAAASGRAQVWRVAIWVFYSITQI